jgi:rhamnose transport system permease protein
MEQLRRYFRPEQLRELVLVFLIALIFLFFGTQIEGYFSPRIFNRVTSDVAIIAVVAIGETLVLLTRNFDLSVGSIVGLTAFAAGKLLSFYPDTMPIASVLFAIGLGATLGLINGVLVAFGRVPSLIVTLGTMAIYRSILVAFPAGTKNVVTHDLPVWILDLGRTNLFNIGEFNIRPVVAVGLVMVAVFQFVITYTRFGRRLYAIGSNPEAAAIGGLPAQRTVLTAFILSGAIAGLGGFMFLVRYGDLTPAAAQGMELQVIAAAVVGGVSTMGGSGTIVGAMLGAMLINLLQQSLLRWPVISTFWVGALLGVLILVSVTIDTVIINRLRDLWARRGLEVNPADKKGVIQEEASHEA